MVNDHLEIKLPEGVEGTLGMIAAKNPQAFVLTVPNRLLEQFHIDQIKSCWEIAVNGTALEGKRLIILDHGMTLQIVDQMPSEPPKNYSERGSVKLDRPIRMECGNAESKGPYVGLNGDIR
jgi:hypothetical protein